MVQFRHWPHILSIEKITLSPGEKPVTPGPTSLTTPAPSWPMTSGMGRVSFPESMW